MRLIIDEVKQQENITIVTGRTPVGTIKGIWKYTKPPVINESYHVELSMTYPCEVDISQKEKLFPSVYLDNDTVIFNGICEGIDNEVYYVRFDIDWIEMLDINAITPKKKNGDYISFSAGFYDIEIYPYTL